MANYDDDLMEDAEEAQPPQRVRSQVNAVRRQKGRGFREGMDVDDDRHAGRGYESLETGTGPGPAKSVEGWVIFITNINEEAGEEDISEACSEYGEVKNIHLNLDRRTGYVKGYAMVEYASRKEAQDAITHLQGTELLAKTLDVTWAFSKGPVRRARAGGARR